MAVSGTFFRTWQLLQNLTHQHVCGAPVRPLTLAKSHHEALHIMTNANNAVYEHIVQLYTKCTSHFVALHWDCVRQGMVCFACRKAVSTTKADTNHSCPC